MEFLCHSILYMGYHGFYSHVLCLHEMEPRLCPPSHLSRHFGVLPISSPLHSVDGIYLQHPTGFIHFTQSRRHLFPLWLCPALSPNGMVLTAHFFPSSIGIIFITKAPEPTVLTPSSLREISSQGVFVDVVFSRAISFSLRRHSCRVLLL